MEAIICPANARLVFLQNEGDVLSPHTHTRENCHVTLVLSGVVEYITHDGVKRYTAGQTVHCDEGIEHSFKAFGGAATLLNLIYAKPARM